MSDETLVISDASRSSIWMDDCRDADLRHAVKRTHRFGGFQRAVRRRTPPDDGTAPVLGPEQVIAPGDRTTQCLLAGGQIARPSVSTDRRRSSRGRSASAAVSDTRAAASSIASGSPSSCRQISATVRRLALAIGKSALTARARSTKSHRRVVGQWLLEWRCRPRWEAQRRYVECVLTRDPQHLATGYQHPEPGRV